MDSNQHKTHSDAITSDLEALSEDLQSQSHDAGDKLSMSAAHEMDQVADAAQAVAEPLEDKGYDSLSGYVREIGSYVNTVSSSLKEKSADELIHDAKNIARNNPMLFLAGGFAIGLGIARIARAGMHNSQDANYEDEALSEDYSDRYDGQEHVDFTQSSLTQDKVADSPEVTWESGITEPESELETSHY